VSTVNTVNTTGHSIELDSDGQSGSYARRHLAFGWWCILGFILLGLSLEGLHGLKMAWYLDPAFETRRLLFTLAHAHGVLLGMLNLGFAVTLVFLPASMERLRGTISPMLMGASVILPAGFLLGGVFIYEGDPGPGVALVPLGATLLVASVGLTAWSVTRPVSGGDSSSTPSE